MKGFVRMESFSDAQVREARPRCRRRSAPRGAGFILILLSALGSAAVSLTLSGAENVVRNPGFEESDRAGNPAYWGFWGSAAGEALGDEFFDREPEGHSGGWSVSIREEGWGRRGWWYTVLRGIKPQRSYSVSVWAKRDRPTGWLPELELFGQKRVMNLYNAEVWQKFDWLLNSGDSEECLLLKLVNSRKPYKLWFDDVVVQEFCIEPDSAPKGGKLSWASTETTALVVFQAELAASERFDGDVMVVGKTLNCEIAVPPEVSGGDFYWRVKAFQNETLLATSAPQKLIVERGTKRLDESPAPEDEILPSMRPGSGEYISFDEELNLILDGERFFPIGIYSLPSEKFTEAKRAGFNVVLTREVEAASRAGLRAIVLMGFRVGAEEKAYPEGSLPGEINRWIIARYLWDEPDQTNASPRKVFESHVREKTADPDHPTAIVVYRPEHFTDYASASDILMTDPYPIPHRPVSIVSESVRAAREAVCDQKPVWAVIQAFNWMDSSQEARRTGWARWPTFREERCMAYLAAINGARGILFFQYAGEGKHDPVNWEALRRVATELKRVSPIFLSRTLALPVSVDVQPLYPSSGANAKRIEWTLKTDGRGTYLIAANNWPGQCRVTFSFDEGLRGVVNVPFEKRRIRARASSFCDVFAEYDVHIYGLKLKGSPARK